MNRDIAAEDEMLNHTNLSVLERQSAHLKYQQHQFLNQQQPPDHHHSLYNPNLTELLSSGVYSVDPTDSVLKNGWSDSVYSGFGLRNGSSQPANFGFPAADLKVKESVSLGKMSRTTSRSESFKKRKFDRAANVEEDNKEKKIKGCVEEGEESKITAQTPSNSNKSKNKISKKKKPNSSSTDVQKPDFIHVRARRGQATDSHSLAERVRREKISERMKYLQDLVPGCDKVTGKAGMLDEIINYVQSLQRQVEFLSMKLAAVNPRLDFNINEIFPKEVFSGSSSGFQTIGVPESLETTNPIYSQLNPLQQLVSCSGMEMVINSNSDTSLRRADDATLSIPEPFYDSSCFPSNSTWDADLPNLYNDSLGFDQGRSSQTSISLQPFAGSMAISNLKMET